MGQLPVLSKQDDIGSSAFVKRLDLKVGYACSNDCLFCVVADKRCWGDQTTEQIKAALYEAFEEGKKDLVLTGGEVTIREDILEIVSYAKHLGFHEIQIQTNGRRFSSLDFCKKMILAGMNVFAPSLHGPNARIHDGLTRSPGSWRQTVLGIHHMAHLGIRTLTNTVITKKNYRHLSEIARLLVTLRVFQFQFAFVHILGNASKHYKKIVPKVSEAAPYIKKGLDIGIKAGTRVMAEAIPFCLMKGYEQYLSEHFIPPVQVREIRSQVDNFEVVRKNVAKVKFPSCLMCKWYQSCEGPWREYPELFGEKEFQPVLN